MLQYDYYQGKLQRDVLEALKLPNIQRQRIRSINEDEKGNIWNPISSAFGHITHEINNENSLTDNVVWTIETDVRQNIWGGTDRGLNKISSDKKTVTRYLTSNTDQQPLASDLIYN